jgi:serine/threonine protein kinase
MPNAKPAALPPDCVIGGYTILRKLAAGGFGLVYLARAPDGAQVALKEYLPSALATRAAGQLQPQVLPDKLSLYRLGLKRFLEEGRSLAQISHPSVVGVRDFLCENETVYLVMNYLEGASLQDFINTARLLAQPTIFSQATILSLFEEVLRGLRVVHQHKMLHLDIKPDNIFITDDNLSVLVDFGASREALRLESQHMAPMYTPGFAAPEMYRRDGAVGPWTDIYAIGACMYACMRGQAPDAYPQRMETEGMTGALARLRDHYCGWLLEAVAWCMELAPEARPQTVFALQHALSRGFETSPG